MRTVALAIAAVLVATAAPAAQAAPPKPITGKRAIVKTVKGKVTVNGRRLGTTPRAVRIPVKIDTTHGTVKIVTTKSKGKTQFGTFSQGAFVLTQTKGGKPLTDLKLAGGNFSDCAPAQKTAHAAKRSRRRLFGHAHGRFRTRGRSSTATVRGTKWMTEDTCEGTRTKDMEGEVVAKSDGLSYNLKTGETVQILCDPDGQPPVSSLFCLAVLSQPKINVYGFGIATDSPDVSSYDLCITNPDGTEQCDTHAFSDADESGFRSAGVGCVPGGGPGLYSVRWRLNGTDLAKPIPFTSTQPKDPEPFCTKP
jgi:hypothetical protein